MSIVKVTEYIASVANPAIVLLRQPGVIPWLFGDTDFLDPAFKRVNKSRDTPKWKVLEDGWGRNTLKVRRPDLTLDKQWTNMFGEHLLEELYILEGHEVTKPKPKEGKQPDREISTHMLESKAETHWTTGTAGEKILGCPFKYAEVPRLFGKPLRIVCMGGAEVSCREQYGNLPGDACTTEKAAFVAFFKTMGIEFIGATDILLSLANSEQTQ
jgi:hypothetical protein